ncbi:MAG TPA: hypothetical protein VMV60_01910 [Thermoanaerobaculia bacterium]|nr:hypothetical protein [Thermoanaerobaculia bacterium]
MSFLALGLVLLQAAAATPAPQPTLTPTPTPRPASAGPRTLQDVARERRLGTGGKGSLVTISGSPSTSSPAPAATPAAGSDVSAPQPASESAASVHVSTVTNDGVVDGAGAVRVNGTIRNGGYKTACNIVITVKILDSRGLYLASGQATPDTALVPPGEIVTFHTLVQAPPGVRGARTNPDRKDLTDGSTSMGGDWKLLGGTEAAVASASEQCGS